MDKRIKESLDQIHAPKSLVDDTIRKMHEVQNGETINKDVKQWRLKPVMGVVTALAACAILVIFGKNMTGFVGGNGANTQGGMNQVADSLEEDDVLNGGSISQKEESLFESAKGLSEWTEILELMKESGDTTMNLTSKYVICETVYESDGKEYQFKILLEDGSLSKQDEVLVANGQFKAFVSYGDGNVEQTLLDITSSSQFCSDAVELTVEDVNGDGKVEFLLENVSDASGTETGVWYSIDASGKVSKIEK